MFVSHVELFQSLAHRMPVEDKIIQPLWNLRNPWGRLVEVDEAKKAHKRRQYACRNLAKEGSCVSRGFTCRLASGTYMFWPCQLVFPFCFLISFTKLCPNSSMCRHIWDVLVQGGRRVNKFWMVLVSHMKLPYCLVLWWHKDFDYVPLLQPVLLL